MAKSWPRFRLATLFTFAFGFAVGLMWNQYVGSFLGDTTASTMPPQSVYLAGAVASGPIELAYKESVTVTEAIALAGGLGMNAGTAVTVLSRDVDGRQSTTELDIRELHAANLLLSSGDVVVINELTD